jgi:hypothetical protein
VTDLRKLAAIDVAFLGPKFVLAEYAVGVIFSITLGIFVLLRSQSYWQVVLGIYFLGLGANYIPMLCWAISIKDRQSARSELGSELTDKGRAMAKYRNSHWFCSFRYSRWFLRSPASKRSLEIVESFPN